MLEAQFTYTACKGPGPYDSVPGWKVKQVDPPDIQRDVIQQSARTLGTFKPPAVSALATMAEIEALPRRLRLDVLDPSYHRSLSHIAAAGRDHTNREAFFAHTLVIGIENGGVPLAPDLVGAPPGEIPRPADLWSADGWLAPFGANAIEDATFTAPPTVSDFSPLDRDMRIDFPDLHPGQRAFVLAAVEQAYRDGKPLVIAGSPVEAAMWASLVTHLMLPTAGWSFEFSTFEHADALPGLVGGSMKVIGIPGEEAATARAVAGEQIRLLESDDEPERLGPDAYRLADGLSLPIGPWSVLAERICAEHLDDEIRRAVDALAADVGTSTDQYPLWGLGAAVLLAAPDMSPRPRELEILAAELATATFPLGAGIADSTANRLIDGILDVLGDPMTVFRRLLQTAEQQLAAGSGERSTNQTLTDHIYRGYVMALLREPREFDRGTMPWLPALVRPSPQVSGDLATSLVTLLDWVDSAAPAARARALVTVGQLADTLGWLSSPFAPAVRALVIDRTADTLSRFIISGHALLADASWPRLPLWLWTESLSPALVRMLGDRPGTLFTAPGALEILDFIIGPLRAAPEFRPVLAQWGMLGWERAAAILHVGDPIELADPPAGRPDRELLAAAALLRTIRLDLAAESEYTSVLGHTWPDLLPNGIIRLATLTDMIDAVQRTAAGRDLLPLVELGLRTLAPSDETAAVAHLALAGRPQVQNAISTAHLTLHRPIAVMPWLGHGRTRTPNQPDVPDLWLIEQLITDRLPPAARKPALVRLAGYSLILPAQQLVPHAHTPRWQNYVTRSPLDEQAFEQAAEEIATEIDRSQDQQVVDDLLAEWVIRACLPERLTRYDPARHFFRTDERKQAAWWPIARRIARADGRERNELLDWVDAVEVAARRSGRHLRAGTPEDPGADEFADSCAREAARLVDVQTRRLLRRIGPSRK